ncbi:hypothetical protein DFP96_10780 [Listeria rocourtiae]|uniref:Uncharacterized protein n=1 Tax=Listeria rocourtiae TaxID=647910 RepID=A0A4R6ZJY6_9LIST|nr:hypothetical protein DFP96_10780 [Listeria rocourtiae]
MYLTKNKQDITILFFSGKTYILLHTNRAKAFVLKGFGGSRRAAHTGVCND